ncbi:unnamed protein product [Camellia sinensis]
MEKKINLRMPKESRIHPNITWIKPARAPSKSFLAHKEEKLSKREREMDPKVTEVSQLFERLKPLLFGMISILVPNSSLSSRVLLTEFRSLPPLFEETPNAVHELTLAS